MRYVKFFPTWFLGVMFTSVALGQPPKLNFGDKGWKYLGANTTRAHWISPENILRGLRSADDSTRLKALLLLGLTAERANGIEVPAPTQVQLRYGALGEDDTQQAILSIDITEWSTAYVAIATPEPGGWRRLGTFSCWCKYDSDGDSLARLVQLQLAPFGTSSPFGRSELVLHESGGGTGYYEQIESRFRVHNGKLVRVASFASRQLDCPPMQPCTLDRRWFYSGTAEKGMGSVLVEGHRTFALSSAPELANRQRDLEVRELVGIKCTTFKWDSELFRYEEETAAPDPCTTSIPH